MEAKAEFPVSEGVRVLAGKTIYKTDKWWCAVLLISQFGRQRIALYMWLKRGDEWKRRQKFAIDPRNWPQISQAIEELLREQG